LIEASSVRGREPVLRVALLVMRPQRRGAELFAHHLAAELRRQGVAARTIYLYGDAGEPALPLDAGDEVLAPAPRPSLERLGFDPRLLRRLLDSLRRRPCDVLQANGSRTVKYAALAKLPARARPRLLYRNIGDPAQWSRGIRRAFYRWVVLPRFDAVVSVSLASQRSLAEWYGRRHGLVHIPRGVDPNALAARASREEVRRAMATPPAAPVVVWVGSLAREKRLDRLLRVIGAVAREVPDVYLWLVGDGPLRADVENEAAKLGLRERVRFAGRREDVGSFLRAADLFALTSDTEGMPGVLLEAGWCGLASVATDVGGTRECLLDGETGVLVAPADEEGMTRAVVTLLRDEPQRQELGRRARGRVEESYTIAAVARAYVDLYKTMLRP
jgi:glycosyltransferase involved in cell wall biosynthesis